MASAVETTSRRKRSHVSASALSRTRSGLDWKLDHGGTTSRVATRGLRWDICFMAGLAKRVAWSSDHSDEFLFVTDIPELPLAFVHLTRSVETHSKFPWTVGMSHGRRSVPHGQRRKPSDLHPAATVPIILLQTTRPIATSILLDLLVQILEPLGNVQVAVIVGCDFVVELLGRL